MKTIFTTLLSFLLVSQSYAQLLTDGDILFTYVFSDADKNIGFIAMKNIAPNESIYFTDNAFLEDKTFASNEGTLQWTSPDSILPKGTQIDLLESSSQYASSIGKVVKSGSFTLSASGDQLLAYQTSETDTVFIAGINWGTKTSWITSGVPTTAQSYLPIGLISHIDFGLHRDNGVFNCPVSKVTTSELRDLLLSVDNWTLSDDRLVTPCTNIEISDPITAVEIKNESHQIILYPNPTLDKRIYFSEKLHNVQIVTLEGKVLIQNEEIIYLDLSHLEQGTYLFISDEIKEKIVLE